MSVGKHLSESISLAGSAKRPLEKTPSSFVIFKNDGHEINKIITALKPKSSCGHDGLSTKMGKQCAPVFSVFLAKVFNKCTDSAYFPTHAVLPKLLLFSKMEANKMLATIDLLAY